MLQEILNHKGAVLTREDALKILQIEGRQRYFQDWPVHLVMALYGVASFFLGSEFLLVFLFAATCLAMAMDRHAKRQLELARAVLFLFDERCDQQVDTELAPQDETNEP